MADIRILELKGMRVHLDMNEITSDDLDDLQEFIAIFRRRFDRQTHAYDRDFVKAMTGCLDAPLN